MRQANPGQDAGHHRQPRLRHRQAQARYAIARQVLNLVPKGRERYPPPPPAPLPEPGI